MEFKRRELEKRVDEVLYYVWDPIGVSDEPCARNEYGTYVLGVLQRVIENEEPAPISEYLSSIVKDNFGLAPNMKQCDYTADLLLKYKRANIIQQMWARPLARP